MSKSTRKQEVYLCSNCGGPFHGLSQCPEDSPRYEHARIMDTIAEGIRLLLEKCTHMDRERIIKRVREALHTGGRCI